MNAWLMTLEVLPGWETPTPVSTLHYLLICLLGPLAVGLVITAIAWGPKMMDRNREEARAEGLGELPAVEAAEEPALAGGARRAQIDA